MQTKDVYVDPILTNISVKFANPAASFLAEKIFPTIPVDKKTGYYFVYDKTNLKSVADERSGNSRANRVDFDMTKTAYGPLIEHSLETFIEDDVLDQYDSPLAPRQDAAEMLTERMLINKEKALATKLTNTGIVTQNVTLSGGDQFSDYGSSDPFSVIQTGKDAVRLNGMVPVNTAIIGYEAWSKIQHHPDLLERVKYSEKGVITVEQFKALFGLQNVWIADAIENTADDGATDAMSYIWGKNLILAYVNSSPKLRSVSFGYHLQLKNARVIDRWDDRTVKGEYVRITDYYENKLVNAEAAYLIKNVVA